jgi:hypothetical protein
MKQLDFNALSSYYLASLIHNALVKNKKGLGAGATIRPDISCARCQSPLSVTAFRTADLVVFCLDTMPQHPIPILPSILEAVAVHNSLQSLYVLADRTCASYSTISS